MPISSIVLALITAGFMLWLASRPGPISWPVALLGAVVVVGLVIWLLYSLDVAPFRARVR